MIDESAFWLLTIGLGIGTYLIRFSFLGLLGGRTLPDWTLVHLKYVGVAIFPAMITPLVLWPAATDGQFDPARLIAAMAAFAIGMRFSVLGAIIAGMGSLYLLQALGL
jgi:branched-subunit amino acid transport protein